MIISSQLSLKARVVLSHSLQVQTPLGQGLLSNQKAAKLLTVTTTIIFLR